MSYSLTVSLHGGRKGEGQDHYSSRQDQLAWETFWACSTRSSALYIYLMLRFNTKRFGASMRLTLSAPRSYHSIVPSISSPSSNTSTMGVCASICFL